MNTSVERLNACGVSEREQQELTALLKLQLSYICQVEVLSYDTV